MRLERLAENVPPRVYVSSKRDDTNPNLRLPTIDVSQNPFEIDGTALLEDSVLEDGELPAATNDTGEKPVLDEPTPMDMPLRDQPEVETVLDDDEDVSPHLRERQKGTSTEEDYLKFVRDSLVTNNPVETKRLPPKDLIGRSFLMPPDEDGERVRAKIVRMVGWMQHKAHEHPEFIKFKCRVNDKYDEVVAYNDIVNYIEKDQTWEGIWNWNKIKKHKGPSSQVILSTKDPDGTS